MFFQSFNQMMTPGVDITLVIRKSADGRMTVSVLPKSGNLKNEAQNSIVPLTVSGLPEELDTGFMQTVFRPVQKVSGLIANMEQFEAQAEKAASNKGTKPKESKEEKEKREKYEKNLKKAQELIAANKHKEAVDALTEARKHAGAENLKKIDVMLEEQKKLMNQGDLFAMMEEPAQPTVPQQAQQPVAEAPVQPVKQPYAHPGQGYAGQYVTPHPQQPQGWPQQASQPAGAYPQYTRQPHGGMTSPAERPYQAYPQNGQAAYPHTPMPFEHEMPVQTIPTYSDEEPSYRPEEYAGYPDFPVSMLQQPQVQPQMI